MDKILLVILDGLGDREIKELGNRTPLEKARTPNLDKLCKKGSTGLLHTTGVGVRPGSDTSHLAILGYDPEKYYSGRGAYEALGTGIKLKKGDVAFRCNLATVDNKMKVVDRRAGRAEAKKLEELINSIKLDTEFTFIGTTGHRGVLVLKGTGLSHKVSDVDTHEMGPVNLCRPLDSSDAADKTAHIVNDFVHQSHEILKSPANKTKANVVLPRGAGTLPEVQSFTARFGLKASAVAGGAVYKGIAMALSMKVIEVKGATADVHTNLDGKVAAALKAFERSDFVFLHIKGTDTCGHDGLFKEKVKFIEKIDKALGKLVDKNLIICVTADHSTPCKLKNHSADPVPILIANAGRRDGTKKFSERDCSRGALGHLTGLEVVPTLLDAIGRAKLYGN